MGWFKDMHGNTWDCKSISGPIIWCCREEELKDWVYSTSTWRGLDRMPSTSMAFDSQVWRARLNITSKQDPYMIKGKDIYKDWYEQVA